MNDPDRRDDYLWDRSGTPDADVERLEQLLRPLGDDVPESFQGASPQPQPRPRVINWASGRGLRLWAPLAAAAGLALALAWSLKPPAARGPEMKPVGWGVECLSGSARIGDLVVNDSALLVPGQRIATDAEAHVLVAVGEIGRIEIGPNSSVRRIAAKGGEHRLSLEQGELSAFIWAPPRQFVVETPSAVATDLGCAYTLAVDDRGKGRLSVTSGWVAFVHEGRESFVPAGATCRTEPGHGPGTPHYAEAPEPLVRALGALDFLDLGKAERTRALESALTSARPDDALTLWHLLTRVPTPERGVVYDALARRVPPPPGVNRDGIVRGDRMMLDLWWNQLGLGTADWWRMWEGPVPSTE